MLLHKLFPAQLNFEWDVYFEKEFLSWLCTTKQLLSICGISYLSSVCDSNVVAIITMYLWCKFLPMAIHHLMWRDMHFIIDIFSWQRVESQFWSMMTSTFLCCLSKLIFRELSRQYLSVVCFLTVFLIWLLFVMILNWQNVLQRDHQVLRDHPRKKD